jgi:hypothetical protein
MGTGYLQPCITYIDIGWRSACLEWLKATIHQEQGIAACLYTVGAV